MFQIIRTAFARQARRHELKHLTPMQILGHWCTVIQVDHGRPQAKQPSQNHEHCSGLERDFIFKKHNNVENRLRRSAAVLCKQFQPNALKQQKKLGVRLVSEPSVHKQGSADSVLRLDTTVKLGTLSDCAYTRVTCWLSASTRDRRQPFP